MEQLFPDGFICLTTGSFEHIDPYTNWFSSGSSSGEEEADETEESLLPELVRDSEQTEHCLSLEVEQPVDYDP
jgi:hypothetical protein